MEKFFTSALGMITLFVLGALAFYLVSGGFSGNWNPFMAATPTPAPTPNNNPTTRIITNPPAETCQILSGQYNKDGALVSPNTNPNARQAACPKEDLYAYPPDSPYYGYYYCCKSSK